MFHIYYHPGIGILEGIFSLIIWVIIISFIIMIFRRMIWHDHHDHWMGPHIGGSHSNLTAIDILKERYAKGEINKQEYEEKKKDLES